MENKKASFFEMCRNKNIICIFMLAMSAGVSFGLILQVLSAWLTYAGISKVVIGSIALLQIPYILKFLWAPFIDNVKIPILYKLGKRTSWIIIIEIFILISTERLGASDPTESLGYTFFWASILSISVASFNIVLDIYRMELLKPEEQAIGVTALISGYRTGGLIVGSALFIFIEYIDINNLCSGKFCNWYYGHILAALISSLGIPIILLAKENKNPIPSSNGNTNGLYRNITRQNIGKILLSPFKELMSRDKFIMLLAFIFFYKLCDAFISVMLNPFLIDKGFTLTQMGVVVKTFGFFATLLGSIIGSIMIEKIGIMRTLLIAAVLQALSNLVFIIQDIYGASIPILYLSIGAENITGSMAVTAIAIYSSNLCNKSFAATQYSFMTSLLTICRVIVGPISGILVTSYGWQAFFFISFLFGLPAVYMLLRYQGPLKEAINHSIPAGKKEI